LVCFQREIGDSDVPGCVGNATLINDGEDDFCIEPPADNALVLFGDNKFPESNYPLGECQGDCDGGKKEDLVILTQLILCVAKKCCFLINR
jgi:hypothetical protein